VSAWRGRDLWLRKGLDSTQTGYRAIRIHSREAVIGPGDPAIDGRRVQLPGVRTSSPSASDCGCASAPCLAGAPSWPERDGQTYSE
jgi:hypothetical protein